MLCLEHRAGIVESLYRIVYIYSLIIELPKLGTVIATFSASNVVSRVRFGHILVDAHSDDLLAGWADQCFD
jgi:hypothetical protein